MLRSNANNEVHPEKSDFNFLKEPEHINLVWKEIENNISIYFNRMIEATGTVASLKNNKGFKVSESSSTKAQRLILLC